MATILLLEDNVPLAEVMMQALRASGHVITHAETGRAGIELLRVQAYDLLITDVVMPDQDGIETVMWMRENQPHVPIITISGDSPRHAQLYLSITQKFGVMRTLLKPFGPELLLRTVAEVLKERPPQAGEP
jgi:two-component system, chemotaxis family, chemotaxis protein CheY